MLAPSLSNSISDRGAEERLLPTELEFYRAYDWCLNPYITVNDAVSHLRDELAKLATMQIGWQARDVTTNIFLLSCGLLNCLDEYLHGPALRLPARLAATKAGRAAGNFIESVSGNPWPRRKVRNWRGQLLAGLNEFLSHIVRSDIAEPAALAEAGRRLMMLLQTPLPAVLKNERLGAPTPFNRLDLTQHDLLALGKSFVQRFPERVQSILVVGLRTSGSYFAPLLKAFFEVEGYENVALLTIEPNKGLSRRERHELAKLAARGYLALIVDDPPHTSRTVLAALGITSRAGFAPDKLKFIAATHPAKRAWFKWLPGDSVITLPPEQWHKRELLNPTVVEARLVEYFSSQKFASVSIVASRRADDLNAHLQASPTDERGVRLKRIFEVQLQTSDGEKQIKYVLAKSVGWGWLSYHAFLVGQRLAGYVPPILGLRDGIVYMEWIPQSSRGPSANRTQLIGACASYVAARAHRLKLKGDPATGIDFKRYNNGVRLLAKTLSRAYGPILTDGLMQARVDRLLRERPCPSHTLIDGNMRAIEWILGPRGPLKTDYEHHGMGKGGLNLTDPAYDLADAILNLALTPEEEHDLIQKYITESGDAIVEQRLFGHKLLAGLWAMNEVQEQLLGSPRGNNAQHDYHRRFMNAWDFLTVHTARQCGSLLYPRTQLVWRTPLVVSDIDGVIDRRVFGFPSTTAAGMRALSLLSAHDFSVALNTARSVSEVKEYCNAYSLAGGVAEHGSFLWDAVNQRGRVLISSETARQLEQLRRALQKIPGVFLDERHQYSIKAFTYREKPLGLVQSILSSARLSPIGDGALGPIPTHVVHQLFVDLKLDRLTFHHTLIDTAIVAKEVDKGTGLIALRNWVLAEDAETIAIGDSEPDLPMFRVASRSFAPANVGCKRQAQVLGCEISSAREQQGLLEIVRKIIHPDGRDCERCSNGEIRPRYSDERLLISLLHAADQSFGTNLLRAIIDPTAYKMFIR